MKQLRPFEETQSAFSVIKTEFFAEEGSITGKIKELASRFWSLHPREIQDLKITRQEFYIQGIEKLVSEAVKAEREACIEDLRFWGSVDESIVAIQKRPILF